MSMFMFQNQAAPEGAGDGEIVVTGRRVSDGWYSSFDFLRLSEYSYANVMSNFGGLAPRLVETHQLSGSLC